MFEAIGYEVSYREGFVEKGYGNRYATKADSYIERLPLYKAIRRAQSSVLALRPESAIVLDAIDTDSGRDVATGFRIMVIVRKDEHLIENLEATLHCFEAALDWEEHETGPYVTLNRAFRTAEWE